MALDVMIIREKELLRDTTRALADSMHTRRMTYANWIFAYQQICDRLGVDSGVNVRQVLLDSIPSSPSSTHSVIINGARASNKTIERKLLTAPGAQDYIQKSVNMSGEDAVKEALRRRIDPRRIVRELEGNGFYILANNKALTDLVLDPNMPERIEVFGWGPKISGYRGGKTVSVSDDKVVVKPVDRSHGDGIVFVKGNETEVVDNPWAIFGSYLVQKFAPAPQKLQQLHRTMRGVRDPKLKLATDMRVMLTELDRGYGVIGHIRVAVNRSGKANLSQDAATPQERAYAIGLNPRYPITDPFDREICRFYGINPDRPKVPQKVAKNCAALMKKFGRPLIGFDFGPTEQDGKYQVKLFEANVTPGSAIYSYYGATKSDELTRFVRAEGLSGYVDRLSVDQLNFPAEEIARHRVVNVLAKVRAFNRIRVDRAMEALGLDNSIYGGDYKWQKTS